MGATKGNIMITLLSVLEILFQKIIKDLQVMQSIGHLILASGLFVLRPSPWLEVGVEAM